MGLRASIGSYEVLHAPALGLSVSLCVGGCGWAAVGGRRGGGRVWGVRANV